MPIRFVALPTAEVAALQAGGPDANGQPPERHVSDGDGIPCRHCLTRVAAGEPYLVLAYRPFAHAQPYAETGPIFLHAERCPRFTGGDAVPEILTGRPEFVMRGYDARDRIVYETCTIVPGDAIRSEAERLLQNERVAYLHVRARASTCYQCRIERR
jgi:hypothetical protein